MKQKDFSSPKTICKIICKLGVTQINYNRILRLSLVGKRNTHLLVRPRNVLYTVIHRVGDLSPPPPKQSH